MSRLKNLIITPWTRHPSSVGESYGQHLLYALRASATVTSAGLMLFIHAFFPFLFVKTGSNMLCKITDILGSRNRDEK